MIIYSQGQDLRTVETLKAAEADPIYREKVSGVRADRPQLAKLMAKLVGDIVVVTKLDRLGRSVLTGNAEPISALVDKMAKARRVGVDAL